MKPPSAVAQETCPPGDPCQASEDALYSVQRPSAAQGGTPIRKRPY